MSRDDLHQHGPDCDHVLPPVQTLSYIVPVDIGEERLNNLSDLAIGEAQGGSIGRALADQARRNLAALDEIEKRALPRQWRPPADAASGKLPPSQPPGWVDPDPLHVEPEPVRRRRYQGWALESHPIGIPWAFVIVAFCAGVLAGALILTIARSVDAAPRSARPAIPAAGSVPPASGNLDGLSGAPPSFPGSDPSGQRGDGGSIPRAVPGGATTPLAVTPVPSPSGEIGGWATYYDTCSECAAAGPLLQGALGPHWKGQTITVASDHGHVDVRLVTSCACGDRTRNGVTKPTIIDLSLSAFGELAGVPAKSPTDPGYVAVSIEIPGPHTTLPPTDTPRSPADLRMMLEVRDDEVYR